MVAVLLAKLCLVGPVLAHLQNAKLPAEIHSLLVKKSVTMAASSTQMGKLLLVDNRFYRCDSNCKIELAAPKFCSDGVVDSGEQCDDGLTKSGDGCSDTCTIESGWTCTGSPSKCVTTCGDSLIAGKENCDDGNNKSGDGCDCNCSKEEGWSCSGTPTACTPICGDKVIVGAEKCDDGNTKNGDGCDCDCKLENGWTCSNSLGYSTCKEICGDGLDFDTYGCDDGNTKNGDGCDSNCKVETGYTCTEGNPTLKDTCVQTIKTGSLSDCQAFAKQFDNTCTSSCNSLTAVPSITKYCNACGSCNG